MVSTLATLTVDLLAVGHNWRTLRGALASDTECGAVVKANAYGLGVAPITQALYTAGCRTFFVAHLQEGVALRRLLPAGCDIYVLQGARAGEETACVAHRLIPVLISIEMARRWQSFAAKQAFAPSALKVNTGMNRLGLQLEEFLSLAAEPDALLQMQVKLLVSHLACADEPAHIMNQTQLSQFQRACAACPEIPASLANSAGVLLGEPWHFALARPGIALYGGQPQLDGRADLKPVVRLNARVIQTRALHKGESVGYGAEFTASEDTQVAIVACGYAEGMLRSLAGRFQGWFSGPLPLLGRVSMDSLVFDLAHVAPPRWPKEGDEIELIGPNISLDTFARAAQTSSYEVLTRLGGRLDVRYSEAGL